MATKACDLWALGCMTYQMLSGTSPIQSGTEYLTFMAIQNNTHGSKTPRQDKRRQERHSLAQVTPRKASMYWIVRLIASAVRTNICWIVKLATHWKTIMYWIVKLLAHRPVPCRRAFADPYS